MGEEGRGLRARGAEASGRVLPRAQPVVTQHQLHQVLLLPARVRGDVPEDQVLPQVLHFQSHELRALEGRFLQQVTGGTSPEVLL